MSTISVFIIAIIEYGAWMFLHLGAVDEDGREVAKVVWRAVIMEKKMMCMAGRDNNIFNNCKNQQYDLFILHNI